MPPDFALRAHPGYLPDVPIANRAAEADNGCRRLISIKTEPGQPLKNYVLRRARASAARAISRRDRRSRREEASQ